MNAQRSRNADMVSVAGRQELGSFWEWLVQPQVFTMLLFRYTMLGAEVTLVAPPTLLPPMVEVDPVKVSHHLDEVLPTADAVYLLRMQRERMTEALLPSLREYTATYGLTRQRASLLRDDAVVMHPGPMNRGVEIAADVADLPRSLITRQVANGVAVRMAVLFLLLGQGPSGPLSGKTGPGVA